MGSSLPKAVTSVVAKRHGGSAFRVGFAEMNGWRPSMEDAHVIYTKDNWAFFGVFDGHGGDQCSAYIARRITEELEKDGPPPDDAAVTELALKLDQEFLDSKQPSGSTGTFVIVTPTTTGTYKLRVGNIGDSRVLLGRADGTIYPGPGTDSGLTTDHKPDLQSERERIEQAGGNVQSVMGVARVNGDLAVSRAFGDASFKVGGQVPADHQVSAAPEFTELECGPTDFLMLVCDGISESRFPNPEVISFAAERLKPAADGSPIDPAQAAIAVCHEAIVQGSKDNLSCMIVLLGGGEVSGKPDEFIPCRFDQHTGFRKAYEGMAKHAGCTLAEALEMRHTMLQKKLKDKDKLSDAEYTELTEENGSFVDNFGTRPAEDLAEGSEERIAWFETWLQTTGPQDPDGQARDQLMEMLEGDPRLMAMAQSRGLIHAAEENVRRVQVASLPELKPAVDAHEELQWDDRLEDACGRMGIVMKDDTSDATSQVKFPAPLSFKAWLPTCMLRDVVRVASIEDLQTAVLKHPDLEWDDKLAETAGMEGLVHADRDGLKEVRFEGGLQQWLPSEALALVRDSE